MPFIGTQPEVGGYSVLDALTASATASYTLQLNSVNFSPASANQLLVSLNGVIQKPGSSFTVSGSTLTFSSALDSSDSIDFIIAMGEPLLVGVPSDGTVTSSKLATDIAISGHAAVGANIIAGTRALSIAGATDGGSSEILNCFNSSLASKFSVRDDGLTTVNGQINASSGIAIGGTGAANLLDDYEEGSWTPTTPNAGSVTVGQGRYVKVGRMVTVWCYIQTISNTSSSNAFDIGGLPFTAIGTGTLDSTVGPVMIRYVDDNATEPLTITSYVGGDGSSLLFYVSRGNNDSYGRVLHSHFNNVNIGLRTQLSYEV